jgi:DNA polymerase epsilon subunit 1
VLLYFIEPNGTWFKARYIFNPYFYVLCDDPYLKEVVFALSRQFEKELVTIEEVAKEDLNLINHLSGKTQKYIRLVFRNLTDLNKVRYELHTQVKKNKIDRETQNAYEGWHDAGDFAKGDKNINFLSKILDIREYDVTFHIRVMIDKEVRCSLWYSVQLEGPVMQSCTLLKEMLDKADLRIMAFDIETTKQPLKFPDVKFDQVMMISYIIDGSGYLITNRQVVGGDVSNFEYAPREDYDCGVFEVFNEPDEKALLIKFFAHIV